MKNDFMIASAEILDIFQYIPIELKNRIPDKLMMLLKESAAKDYVSIVDPDKSITEQKISERTKTILSILYLKYWANEEQKKETYKKISQNEIEYQKELREKYNPDNIFIKNHTVLPEKQEIPKKQENALVKVKEETFIQKIINKIKSIFKRHN